MNKYASGYTLLQVLSGAGWLVLVASIIGGIFVGANAPRNMGWIGFVVAIAGGFQGLLLIGVSAIGDAVLDGSVAQQEARDHARNKNSDASSADYQKEILHLGRCLVASSMGVPGGEYIGTYKGIALISDVSGKIKIDKEVFGSADLARIYIDDGIKEEEKRKRQQEIAGGIYEISENGDLIFSGYKVPRRNDGFLLLGKLIKEPKEVVAALLEADEGSIWKYKLGGRY